MFDAIKDFFGFGESARAYIVVQSQHAYEGGFHFFVERCIRYAGLQGWMRVVQKPMYEYIELEIEGSKYKINKFIATLQKAPKGSQASGVEIAWKTYKKMYADFQVRL